MHSINQYLERCADEMVTDLKTLVNMDSGSYDKAGVDRVITTLSGLYEQLGFEVCRDHQQRYGDNLVAYRSGSTRGKFLLLGHVDTVFGENTTTLRPFTIEGSRAYGPGVCDMKGGLVTMYHALRALSNLAAADLPEIAVVLNGDEEIGSPSSRALIEAQAQDATHCFVLEPAREDGSLVTARKGVGLLNLEICGVAAHAGANHESGRSAIEELAHKILALHRLTDYERGITVNVGVVSGGERTNVVSDKATARVDLRVEQEEDADEVLQRIAEIAAKSHVQGTVCRLEGGLNRPPMPRTQGTAEMFSAFDRAAQKLGITALGERSTGGGSDGNFVSALGVPVLDALGPVGGKSHSEDEYIEVDSLVERSQLLAQGILEIAAASK